MDSPEQLAFDLAQNLRARARYLGARRVGPPPVAGESEPSPPTVDTWDGLRAEAMACEQCGLSATRTTVVFGEGAEDAELVFIGEAPGRDEDEQGRPFVGRSGKLLTQMIQAMGFARDEVYIANVLKCRPPANRDPAADEVEQCRPYLLRQLALLQPKIICTLGRHALRTLTGYEGPIGKVRGRPMPFQDLTVIPTFHPAYLLRNPAAKRDAWEDLKTVLRQLGRPIPQSKKA